jgi:2-methylisocitrate lyase-like PEP mutase family enzyme
MEHQDKRRSLKQALERGRPLVSPVPYDALSAKLIQLAGFESLLIAGSPMIAARYCLPDIGLVGLKEMAAGVDDILAACDLPAFVDIDDGYGDIANVVHTVRMYDRLGAAAVVIEDQQRATKQPGESQARALIAAEDMCGKIRAAAQTRGSEEFLIIARSDARQLETLDGAMRRAEKYLAAGASGIFIPGLKSSEELDAVGQRFRGSLLSTAMFEGREPWLPPRALYDMGYRHVVYPTLLLNRMVGGVQAGLADLQALANGSPVPPGPADASSAATLLNDAIGTAAWRRLAAEFTKAS